MLELKQRVSRLSARECGELSAYSIRLRQESPAWRRTATKRLKDMNQARKVTAAELDSRLRGA